MRNFYFISVGILTGILLNGLIGVQCDVIQLHLLNLLIIDWQAISAIATIAAVVVAFFTLKKQGEGIIKQTDAISEQTQLLRRSSTVPQLDFILHHTHPNVLLSNTPDDNDTAKQPPYLSLFNFGNASGFAYVKTRVRIGADTSDYIEKGGRGDAYFDSENLVASDKENPYFIGFIPYLINRLKQFPALVKEIEKTRPNEDIFVTIIIHLSPADNKKDFLVQIEKTYKYDKVSSRWHNIPLGATEEHQVKLLYSKLLNTGTIVMKSD